MPSDPKKKPRARRIVLDTGPQSAQETRSMVLLGQRFIDYVQHERALSENTQAAYRRDLRTFGDWLAGRDATNLTVSDLGDYFASLTQRGLARASVARQAATIRTFYGFLQLEGIVQESPAELISAARRDDSIPGTLLPLQVDRLLESPDLATSIGQRDKALLELAESFCTCRGKGNKERVVPLGRRAIEAVSQWLKGPRPLFAAAVSLMPAWVLLSSRGNRLSRMRIWEIVRMHADKVGLPSDIGPHTLRHSFATHLVAGGVDLRHVQEMLGHASIATTQRYTHVDASRLKSVHGKFHPRR